MEVWYGKRPGDDVWIIDDGSCREGRTREGRVLATLLRDRPADVIGSLTFAGVTFQRCLLGPGERHPRVHRGRFSPLGQNAYGDAWNMGRMALRNLCLDMVDIFRRVEPDGENAASIYGHEIRNLLALACMEVESSWKAILVANHYRSAGTNLCTNDYVRLLAPLRLAEYEIRMPRYRRVPPFRPFTGWSTSAPTRSLDWYAAYNGTKHDRETKFQEATLLRMIHALGGAFVMMHAQFGQCRSVGMGSTDYDDFYVVARPQWPEHEDYVPPGVVRSDAWRDVDLPL